MQLSKHLLALPNSLRKMVRLLGDVTIPQTCLTCDRFVAKQGGCCSTCWSQLRFITKPLCPVMGSPFSIDMGDKFLSAEAIADPPPFDALRAVVLYDELARKLVSSIKYSDRTDLVPSVAKWMSVFGKELVCESDLIVPVPLHSSRLRQRRFNQAAELCRYIAREASVEFCSSLLVRHRSTRQQVGLTEKERARNVQSAFRVPADEKHKLNGKHVLLVDDVYTTGATAKAATRALKRSGALKVNVLVFAKVETATL